MKNPILHGLILQIAFLALLWQYSVAILYAFLIQAALAIILLEYVNYMQHYGLRRDVGERHTEMHSWEHRGVWSRWTLLELPLHPAHHLKASTPMWDLQAYEIPQLPVVTTSALVNFIPSFMEESYGQKIGTIVFKLKPRTVVL